MLDDLESFDNLVESLFQRMFSILDVVLEVIKTTGIVDLLRFASKHTAFVENCIKSKLFWDIYNYVIYTMNLGFLSNEMW